MPIPPGPIAITPVRPVSDARGMPRPKAGGRESSFYIAPYTDGHHGGSASLTGGSPMGRWRPKKRWSSPGGEGTLRFASRPKPFPNEENSTERYVEVDAHPSR